VNVTVNSGYTLLKDDLGGVYSDPEDVSMVSITVTQIPTLGELTIDNGTVSDD